MNSISIIKEIEENYDINSIVSNELPIWQYIRNLIYSQANPSKKTSTKIKSFYTLIQNHNWGNSSASENYKYLLFTDSREEILYNNKIVDKTSQNLIEILKDDLLVVINPSGQKHLLNSNYDFNHMSSSFFHYNRWVSGIKKSCFIENSKELDQIFKKNNIILDVDYFNRLFFTYTEKFSEWLMKIAPKAVFINCYYSLFHQALIYACKKQGIKTIEIQHGLISDSHNQYSPEKFIGKHTMPDYLLCYNEYVKTLTNQNYMLSKNITPIGHYYLEQTLNNEKYNSIKPRFNSYDKVVAVSTQNDLEQELIKFIEEIALIKPDYLFIIKTRDNKRINSRFENIKIDSEVDMYSLINQADLHISCYSTVALEASMIGTPTILININNMSKLYYNSIVQIFKNIKICDSNNEVLSLMENWSPNNTTEKPYVLNNKKRIKQFLDNYIK